MNDQLRESLSALLDDEAEPMEVRRVLKEMEGNADVLATWQRLQIASSALRSEMPFVGDDGQCVSIADRVSQALKDEPAYQVVNTPLTAAASGAETATAAGRFGRPLASLAMAATVAAVTVVAVLQYQGATAPAAPEIAGNASNPSIVRVATTQNLNAPVMTDGLSRTVSASVDEPLSQQKLTLARSIHQIKAGKMAARDRLQGYLQRHAEHAAFNNNQGIMPMARVVNASHVEY